MSYGHFCIPNIQYSFETLSHFLVDSRRILEGEREDPSVIFLLRQVWAVKEEIWKLLAGFPLLNTKKGK